MATAPTDLVFIYTNHRGETAERRVVPEAIRFASTQWHREPQWLLVAYDLDRGERRDFAWKDIRFGDAALPIETPAEGLREAERIARVISASYGEDPDADAPIGKICGPNNEPLPCWMAYEEQAEAIIASTAPALLSCRDGSAA